MTCSTSTTARGFLMLALSAALGRATNYNKIQPKNLQFENEMLLEGDSAVSIAYRYDVLRNAGNGKYAKFEKRSDFSLLGMRIVNNSDDTLHFPEDFGFYTDSFLIEPLQVDSIAAGLSQLVKAEKAKENLPIDEDEMEWYVFLPTVTNLAIRANADVRLMKELEEYYLVYSDILPYKTVHGLVALPVKKNTPTRAVKR